MCVFVYEKSISNVSAFSCLCVCEYYFSNRKENRYVLVNGKKIHMWIAQVAYSKLFRFERIQNFYVFESTFLPTIFPYCCLIFLLNTLRERNFLCKHHKYPTTAAAAFPISFYARKKNYITLLCKYIHFMHDGVKKSIFRNINERKSDKKLNWERFFFGYQKSVREKERKFFMCNFCSCVIEIRIWGSEKDEFQRDYLKVFMKF